MNSKLTLKNRKTGQQREVSDAVWEAMQKDGRSIYWTATPVLNEKPEIEVKPFYGRPKKEKIVIENIFESPKEEPKPETEE
jgi:hypothetical protein